MEQYKSVFHEKIYAPTPHLIKEFWDLKKLGLVETAMFTRFETYEYFLKIDLWTTRMIEEDKRVYSQFAKQAKANTGTVI